MHRNGSPFLRTGPVCGRASLSSGFERACAVRAAGTVLEYAPALL